MDERELIRFVCTLNPSYGLPLREALICYNNRSEFRNPDGQNILPIYQTLRLRLSFPDPDWPWKAGYLDEMFVYERIFSQLLIGQLYAGTLIAKGYTAVGQITRTIIPADWWTVVELNVADNWAEAHGTRVFDVYVLPNPETELCSVPARQKDGEAPAATSIVDRMEAWYLQERVALWCLGMKIPTQAEDRQAAKREFPEAPRAMIDEVRRRCAPPEWDVGRRGRKKTKQ